MALAYYEAKLQAKLACCEIIFKLLSEASQFGLGLVSFSWVWIICSTIYNLFFENIDKLDIIGSVEELSGILFFESVNNIHTCTYSYFLFTSS